MAAATDNIDKTPTIGVARAVISVCLPFALGYFLSYLYRTVNAVISDRLSQDVGLDAHGLGLLTSVYFLAFAVAQYGIGATIHLFAADAGNHYPLAAYQAAIGTFLVLQALSFLWFLIPAKKGN